MYLSVCTFGCVIVYLTFGPVTHYVHIKSVQMKLVAFSFKDKEKPILIITRKVCSAEVSIPLDSLLLILLDSLHKWAAYAVHWHFDVQGPY